MSWDIFGKSTYLEGVDSRELESLVVLADIVPEEVPECLEAFLLAGGCGSVGTGGGGRGHVVEDDAHQGHHEVGRPEELGAHVALDPLEQRVGAATEEEKGGEFRFGTFSTARVFLYLPQTYSDASPLPWLRLSLIYQGRFKRILLRVMTTHCFPKISPCLSWQLNL